MNNVLKEGCRVSKLTLGELRQGDVFRYVGSNPIYMKTSNVNGTVSVVDLVTGALYPSQSNAVQVEPVPEVCIMAK